MSFPAYPHVSDSDVSWLGSLPSHWSVARVRQLFEIKKRIVGSLGHDVLSITQSGIRIKDIESNDGQLSMDYSKYQIVEPGDFAMNHMDLLTGWVDISTVFGVTSPDYRVFTKRVTADIECRFFNYIFQMGYAQKLFYPLGQGSSQLGRWRLPSDAFNEFFLPVPSREEQTAIVAFLDRETGKIDALVEEQRRLRALLKEKRQAVISHTVTKGLNPDVAMKDSSIEWLGAVPVHWELSKIKFAASHVVDCLHTTPTYDGEVKFPAIRTADIEPGRLLLNQARLVSQAVYEERIQRLEPRAGDILYSREGERFGMAALVPENVNLCLGQRMMMFRVLPKICSTYVMWMLNSDAILHQVDLATGGSTSPHINISDIINFNILLPPYEEQDSISRYIQDRADALDEAVSTAEDAIALLQERRAALICAAVTGKIDVSSAQVLSFPLPRTRVRGLIAAEIVERSAHQATFGRVKLQKIAYLAEVHAGVSELEGVYLREAAGPLDRDMISVMEREAAALSGIRVEQPDGPGSAVIYRLGDQRGAHRQDLATLLSDRAARFDKLIADIATIDTKGAEAVATLYAVWNDALIDGRTPSDMEIAHAVLSEWHPEKAKKFRTDELQTWLGWMRRHGLVPVGAGPRTSTGRLFA